MKIQTIAFSLIFSSISLHCSNSSFAQDFEETYLNYEASQESVLTTTHRIPRRDYELHANEYQPRAMPNGSPILLLHGFPDSSHLYDRLATLLAEQRRVISFDFLGWGKSDKPEQHSYNVESLRVDIESVISYFQLESVVIVVHDLSGLPGIDWVLDNAANTEELILLNTIYATSEYSISPPVIKTLSTHGLFSRTPLALGISLSMSRFQAGVFDQVSEFMSNDEIRVLFSNIFAHQAALIRPAFLGLTDVFYAELQARNERISEINTLNVPTKIIFGADDPYLNTNVGQEFDSMFPVSRLKLIRGAGHYVQLDQAELVAQEILADWQ